MKGKLIVFEGIDGCGKTTQNILLQERFKFNNIDFVVCREPGGTSLGERIRGLLLDPETVACPRSDALMYQVARAQLVEEFLKPRIENGELILMDRFYHSTIAYQGYGSGLDVGELKNVIDFATNGLKPDLTLYFQIDPEVGARRRAKSRGEEDRIEARGLEYLTRVANGYNTLLETESDMVAVDVTKSVDEIHEEVYDLVSKLL